MQTESVHAGIGPPKKNLDRDFLLWYLDLP